MAPNTREAPKSAVPPRRPSRPLLPIPEPQTFGATPPCKNCHHCSLEQRQQATGGLSWPPPWHFRHDIKIPSSLRQWQDVDLKASETKQERIILSMAYCTVLNHQAKTFTTIPADGDPSSRPAMDPKTAVHPDDLAQQLRIAVATLGGGPVRIEFKIHREDHPTVSALATVSNKAPQVVPPKEDYKALSTMMPRYDHPFPVVFTDPFAASIPPAASAAPAAYDGPQSGPYAPYGAPGSATPAPASAAPAPAPTPTAAPLSARADPSAGFADAGAAAPRKDSLGLGSSAASPPAGTTFVPYMPPAAVAAATTATAPAARSASAAPTNPFAPPPARRVSKPSSSSKSRAGSAAPGRATSAAPGVGQKRARTVGPEEEKAEKEEKKEKKKPRVVRGPPAPKPSYILEEVSAGEATDHDEGVKKAVASMHSEERGGRRMRNVERKSYRDL